MKGWGPRPRILGGGHGQRLPMSIAHLNRQCAEMLTGAEEGVPLGCILIAFTPGHPFPAGTRRRSTGAGFAMSLALVWFHVRFVWHWMGNVAFSALLSGRSPSPREEGCGCQPVAFSSPPLPRGGGGPPPA